MAKRAATRREARWSGPGIKPHRKVRINGEHPFLVIKRLFGFAKLSYHGVAQNGKASRHNKLTILVKCVLVISCKMRSNCGSLRRSIDRSRH